MGELKNKTLKGFAWSTIQSLASTGISFFFMIFMTRLLAPKDYGMIGMVGVFMAVAGAFVECGFGQALIRRQNRTAVDESTVFYFNITASIVCYIILFLIAPFISSFYKMPELTIILRILALTLVIGSLSSVHVLMYKIEMNFKVPSLINLISGILTGCVGVYIASLGKGVWALVAQQLMSATFITIAYWTVSKWRPIRAFSVQAFREMFSFGSRLLGSRLLNVFYANISPMVIGRYYSAADLGLSSKGSSLAGFPAGILQSNILTVTYPALCKLQTDKESLALIYRKFIRASSFVLFPIMTCLAVVATPLMIFLFGEKWAESGVYMALACFPWMIVPAQCLNFNLLQVVGRSDLVLRLEIITKIMGVTMLCITLPISIKAMFYGTIVNTVLCLIINITYITKFVGMSAKDQFVDILRSAILAFAIGIVVYIGLYFVEGDFLKILIGSLTYFLLFGGIAVFIRMKEFHEIIDVFKRK